jgi:hypothetical protein
MSPDTLFTAANNIALAGWLVLAAGVALRRPALVRRIAGWAVPLLLSALYAALLAIAAPRWQGGFGSLAQVGQLFDVPMILLAGWVHYLAFDLLIGAWIAQRSLDRGDPRWLLIPVLPLTLLLGPVGLLAHGAIVALRRATPVAA